MKSLAGKTALVVGAASPDNIGQAIVRRFMAAGAQVMAAGRHAEALSALATETGSAYELCDITRSEDLTRLIERTLERFGSLDVAVNATGRNHRKPFLDTTREELDELTAVQFVGPFLFMQAAVRAMMSTRRGGSVIQISSVTSTMLLHDHALYMGTKAGIDHVVRSVAYDHGPDGIRINSISPGPTADAPMAAHVFQDAAAVERLTRRFPLRRIGTTADIAEVAVWLASDGCFVTGQLIQANGGLTLPGLDD